MTDTIHCAEGCGYSGPAKNRCASCPVSPDTPRPCACEGAVTDPNCVHTPERCYDRTRFPSPTVESAREKLKRHLGSYRPDEVNADMDAIISAVRQEEAAKHQAVRTVAMECRKALGDVALLLDANKEFEAYRLIAQTLDRFPLPEVPR